MQTAGLIARLANFDSLARPGGQLQVSGRHAHVYARSPQAHCLCYTPRHVALLSPAACNEGKTRVSCKGQQGMVRLLQPAATCTVTEASRHNSQKAHCRW